jgi:hypothetical protein
MALPKLAASAKSSFGQPGDTVFSATLGTGYNEGRSSLKEELGIEKRAR